MERGENARQYSARAGFCAGGAGPAGTDALCTVCRHMGHHVADPAGVIAGRVRDRVRLAASADRILQVAAPADKEIAAASITTVQLFATALGAALAGMIVNVNGFNDGTLTGVMSSAYWLMMLLAIAPLIAIFTARRCAAVSYG